MSRNDQVSASVAQIQEAFRLFAQARQHMTIGEFQDAVANRLTELGSQGFVASIGAAIVAASAHQQYPSRPMTGIFDSLSPEQQKAALSNKDVDV